MTIDVPPLHICIATAQNVANMIPAVQCKAEEVWVLETPTMKARNNGRNLAAALRKHGIKADIRALPESPEAMQQFMVELADELDAGGRHVTVNMTGGTKPMSLALVEAARMLDTSGNAQPAHVVYTNTGEQRLEWSHPRQRHQDMQAVLEINDILRVHGYEHDSSKSTLLEHDKWLEVANERKRLTYALAAAARKFQHPISTLAWHASQALRAFDSNGDFDARQALDSPASGSMREYINMLEEQQILENESGTAVLFRSPEDARYCAGGWVEEFVALKAEEAAKSPHPIRGNWRGNVHARSVDAGTLNEIDLMVTHNNRALVIECKAAQLRGENVNDWLSKLQELAQRVAGSHAGRLLVSAHPLTEAQRERAQLMGIGVCAGDELQHFGRYLHKWMTQGNFRDLDAIRA